MCQKENVFTAEGPPAEAAPPREELPALSEALPPTKRQRKKSLPSKQSKVKGLPVPEGVSFVYYGRPTRADSQKRGAFGHQGVMTVAIRIPPASETAWPRRVLLMGLSFCSPKDSWCKAKGRGLAMVRLYDDPIVVPFLYEPHRLARQAALALTLREFQKLQDFGVGLPRNTERIVPGWAKGLAGRLAERRVSGISRLHKDPQIIDSLLNILVRDLKPLSYESPGIPLLTDELINAVRPFVKPRTR